jgi:hypothetical protein
MCRAHDAGSIHAEVLTQHRAGEIHIGATQADSRHRKIRTSFALKQVRHKTALSLPRTA